MSTQFGFDNQSCPSRGIFTGSNASGYPSAKLGGIIHNHSGVLGKIEKCFSPIIWVHAMLGFWPKDNRGLKWRINGLETPRALCHPFQASLFEPFGVGDRPINSQSATRHALRTPNRIGTRRHPDIKLNPHNAKADSSGEHDTDRTNRQPSDPTYPAASG